MEKIMDDSVMRANVEKAKKLKRMAKHIFNLIMPVRTRPRALTGLGERVAYNQGAEAQRDDCEKQVRELLDREKIAERIYTDWNRVKDGDGRYLEWEQRSECDKDIYREWVDDQILKLLEG